MFFKQGICLLNFLEIIWRILIKGLTKLIKLFIFAFLIKKHIKPTEAELNYGYILCEAGRC